MCVFVVVVCRLLLLAACLLVDVVCCVRVLLVACLLCDVGYVLAVAVHC